MADRVGWLPDVDRLRRREPGPVCLVYLDQSVLSGLVREVEWQGVLELLRRGVRERRLVCPVSRDHDRESTLARSASDLYATADELSGGVRFRDDRKRPWRELRAAAEVFLDRPASQKIWEEAFETDPDSAVPPRKHSTSAERALPRTYVQTVVREGKLAFVQEVAARVEQQRGASRDFETAARASLDQVVEYTLRPLRFAPRLKGTALQPRLPELVRRFARILWLVALHPDLGGRLDEFALSDALRHMPTLAYPALLLAAAEVDGQVKLRAGDRYDIPHLVAGLSRCDIVTCDAAWARRCRERSLVPAGCLLFSSTEREALAAHLAGLLGD